LRTNKGEVQQPIRLLKHARFKSGSYPDPDYNRAGSKLQQSRIWIQKNHFGLTSLGLLLSMVSACNDGRPIFPSALSLYPPPPRGIVLVGENSGVNMYRHW
jgi:hypothetical protein